VDDGGDIERRDEKALAIVAQLRCACFELRHGRAGESSRAGKINKKRQWTAQAALPSSLFISDLCLLVCWLAVVLPCGDCIARTVSCYEKHACIVFLPAATPSNSRPRDPFQDEDTRDAFIE
jgi:hypothetical protein